MGPDLDPQESFLCVCVVVARKRDAAPAMSRVWKIVNRNKTNSFGQPVAYKVLWPLWVLRGLLGPIGPIGAFGPIRRSKAHRAQRG